ncbi:hypothetical protein KGY72_07630 [Candidatus Bipolaricaulota bacterium]|nr:hypothetical protein [Candidatus Bipolaricaulota bacterium]
MAKSEKSVFFDSTVLINFGEIKAFNLLIDLYPERIVIAEEVRQDIFEESYRTEKVLKKYLKEGSIDTLTLSSLAELSLYNEYSNKLDPGEAATIVAASRNNGIVATDDRDARRIARNKENLKITGSVGILLRSVSKNLKTVQEAEGLHSKMIEKANYFSPINSLKAYIEKRDLDSD